MECPVRVSVVVPAYNAGETIARALDSVLIQTYPAAEIIVVERRDQVGGHGRQRNHHQPSTG